MSSYTIDQHAQMIKLYYQNECSSVKSLRALSSFYGRRRGPSKSVVAKFETTGLVVNQPAFVPARNARLTNNIVAVHEREQYNPSQPKNQLFTDFSFANFALGPRSPMLMNICSPIVLWSDLEEDPL